MEESSTSADPKQVVVEMPKATVVSENAKETFYRKNAGKQPAPKPPSPPKKTAVQAVADTAKKAVNVPVAAGAAVVTAGTAVATKAAEVTVDTAKKVVTAPVTAAKAVAATVAK